MGRLNILQGLGDSLLGHRRTGEPVLTQALRVDDVLARLHRHVLAHLAGVARGQLRVFKINEPSGTRFLLVSNQNCRKTSLEFLKLVNLLELV